MQPVTETATADTLSSDEVSLWRTFFLAAHLMSDSIQRDLQQECGLSLMHVELLLRLSESPDEELRMSDLASSAQTSRSRLSHIMVRLEELGYIARRGCPSDRRGSFAVLTDAGRAALKTAAPIYARAIRERFLSVLSDEDRRQLAAMSHTLLRSSLPGGDEELSCQTLMDGDLSTTQDR